MVCTQRHLHYFSIVTLPPLSPSHCSSPSNPHLTTCFPDDRTASVQDTASLLSHPVSPSDSPSPTSRTDYFNHKDDNDETDETDPFTIKPTTTPPTKHDDDTSGHWYAKDAHTKAPKLPNDQLFPVNVWAKASAEETPTKVLRLDTLKILEPEKLGAEWSTVPKRVGREKKYVKRC